MSFQEVYAKLERVFCTELVFGGWCIFKTEKHIILERAPPDCKSPTVEHEVDRHDAPQPLPKIHEKVISDEKNNLEDQINFLRLFQLRSVTAPPPPPDDEERNRALNQQLRPDAISTSLDPSHPDQSRSPKHPSCFNPHLIHDNPSASDNNNNSGKATAARCSQCGANFAKFEHLSRHVRSVHLGIKYDCPHCRAAYSRPYLLRKHIATLHKAEAEFDAGKDGGKDGGKDIIGGSKKGGQTNEQAKKKGKRSGGGCGGVSAGVDGGDVNTVGSGERHFANGENVDDDKSASKKTPAVRPSDIKQEAPSSQEKEKDTRDVSKTQSLSLPQRTKSAPLTIPKRRPSSRTELISTPSTSNFDALAKRRRLANTTVAVKSESKSSSSPSSPSKWGKKSTGASPPKPLRQLQPLLVPSRQKQLREQTSRKKQPQPQILPQQPPKKLLKPQKRRLVRVFPLVKTESSETSPVVEIEGRDRNQRPSPTSPKRSPNSPRNKSVGSLSARVSPSKTAASATPYKSWPSSVKSYQKIVEVDVHDDSLTYMLSDANANNVIETDVKDVAAFEEKSRNPSSDPPTDPSRATFRTVSPHSDVVPSTSHSPTSSSSAASFSSTVPPLPKKRVYAPSIFAKTVAVDGKKRWLCPYCPEPCKSVAGLRNHLFTDHVKEKRKFVCQKCLMVCESNGRLQRHSTVHEKKALSTTL